MVTKNNMKEINKYYNYLLTKTKKHYFVGIVNEWIVDNYYLLVEKEEHIKNFLKNKKQIKFINKNFDMILMLNTILKECNYKTDEISLTNDIKNYCIKNNISLTYEEIEILPIVTLMLLINKVNDICKKEKKKFEIEEKVDKLIKKLKKKISKNTDVSLEIYLDNKTDDYFIICLNEKIKDLGNSSYIYFKQFNEYLNANNLSLKKIINKVHLDNTNDNIVITNVFLSIKKIDGIEIENLVSSLSPIEEILNKISYYRDMTNDSKSLYRHAIVKKAKKMHINTNEYIKTINLKNIENIIFKDYSKNKFQTYIYLFFICGLSLLLSFILSFYFIKWQLLGFLILLIPCSELVITIINKIWLRFVPINVLVRLNFEEGIPDKYKTMVVVPTIVKSKEKVNEVFDNLETYYLSNKTDNLYFTLLGDASQSNVEDNEIDDEVINACIEKASYLNKKYNKEIFYFAYRARKYSKSENAYLGFERKRGALLHFNDLILGNMSKDEQNYWFKAHSFHNFKHDIKYVITLDVDTQLVLNSAIALVGTMAHPFNQPLLNKEKTKVIKGYGLIQPKISVDIESTNKSLFSQIYAGIGGLDPYSSISPNFYQDVFGEGSFIGKGIYDLKVYQQVLKGNFPNELILSHDLLEGTYLRCGYVSDIELFDDFPSKFLVDATRRSRWARGDIQIISWIKRKVKNEKNEKIKNPISLLNKWKIFDNIRRELLDFCLLLIILFMCFSVVHPYWWLSFVLLILILPVISYIIQIFYAQDKNSKNLKYYNIMAFGYQAFILRTLSVFTSIPYNAFLYLKSFTTSLYRMFISKKHLLQWLTAEDASKQINNSFRNHIKCFWINYVFTILIIVIAYYCSIYKVEMILIALLFLLGPFVAYILSLDIKSSNAVIKADDVAYLTNIAKNTWHFFEDNLIEENNYLIPDNYQLNREQKEDYKTSPTDIGMSLLAIVSAYELHFIDIDKACNYIENIISTIEKMDKWNGHLYNWYRIKTLEVLLPRFISTVDSGNFVSSLIVVKEFLKNNNKVKLIDRIEKLINDTNFKVLYTQDDVFSIGYNIDEGVLLPYNYNKFASESRITSFLAIAKGDVASKHWFNLDKTLTTYKNRKGLVSWSGTSFEYFMPLIFMPSYENTLIDESYDFAYFAQKEFMKEYNHKLPWGISESAYNELDDSQNYKYKAFATPYLKLQEQADDRVVISPYSSILAITKFPKEVIKNIKKLEKLNLLNRYGFYEAYDTFDNIPVYSYFAHHQGMILSSLTNYLKKNIIQNYFMSDVNNHAFEILNKEKVQLKPIIDLKITKYKSYTYDKEEFINDIRVFHHLSVLPELSVLSNSKYSVFINDRGNGFSRYRTIQLNRYRKITEQDYGIFLYIKDVKTNKIWCNTYAPINKMPEKYEVVFALDRIKFVRLDDEIITTTEIVVPRTFHAEIRKVTFKNTGNEDKILELTSYTEPIICENIDDISHRSFQSLFIKSEYDKDTKSIIMHRKLRNSNNKLYLINKLLIFDPYDKFSYETDRKNFIGRNNNGENPIALNKKLSNKIGSCIDPIISLRNKIVIRAGEEKTVYLINGFGKSKEQVINIVNNFDSPIKIEEKAFEMSTIMSNVTNKMVNITGNDMRLYNTMLNYLYQTSHISINEERKEILTNNILNQTNLWKFGISGDRPIVFLQVKDLNDLNIIKEFLHAFEHYKTKSIFIDLIILNTTNNEEKNIIANEIDNEKYHMYAINSFDKTPGNIYNINPDDVTVEEINLFKTTSRLYIDCSKYYSLEEFVNNLQKLNTISRREKILTGNCVHEKDTNVEFYNGYGGFKDNGKKYIISNFNTPVIWSNVLANEHFGSIISNNATGFTFANNSHEYKLTSWTCDNLLNDLSEGIKFNNTRLNFNYSEMSFGRILWSGKWKNFEIEIKQFVACEDPIKFYKIKIKNLENTSQNLNLKYWLNPCLGVTEEKTSRYILSNFYEEENFVSLVNKYNPTYNHLTTFMSSTLPIKKANIKRILSKEIETNLVIESNQEKEVAFMLGCSKNEDVSSILSKYKTIDTINDEENKVIKYWQNKLEKIQIKTSHKSFDYMLNGWLLYQTITSRLYAKAGFYQVGGAFGYRDQLQDAMNICYTAPEITKKQILWNAKHQFVQGDVLHWWHKDNMFGLRSRYKDDYLWLIFATYRYITITEDYTILRENVPFVEGEKLNDNEMEKGIVFNYSSNYADLYEHCRLALTKALNELGENGLPLMGGGDWNDGMNKVGEKGHGTSVWLGFFLCIVLDYFIKITGVYDKNIDVSKYKKEREKLVNNLNKVAWDGNYYLRAFFDNGHKLGSKDNKECKIDLISQCFAILANIPDNKKIASILKAIEINLVDKKTNIVKLLTPAFDNNPDNPGYIMDYPVGIRENGGQYTHAVAWYIQALIKVNKFDEAFNIFQMINPILRTDSLEKANKYELEPYVISADIYSNPDFNGKGGWNWYTGSAGWFYYVGLNDIIGFKKVGNKLFIEPHVPKDWKNFEITYKYSDKTIYHISVNFNKRNELIIDNIKQKKKYINLIDDKKEHNVVVNIGGE